MTRFNLEDFPELQRRDAWARALPALFPCVRFANAPSHPSSGSVEGTSLSDAQLWLISAPAQRLRNADDNGHRDNFLSILVPEEGLVTIRQNGRQCCLGAGSFGLIDGTRDFEIFSATPIRHLLLRIPQPIITERSPHLLKYAGRAFSGGGGELVHRLIFHAYRVMTDLTVAEQAAALSSILSLLTANVRQIDIDHRVEGALAQIETSFRDPDLCATDLAVTQGLSRRRLDELFKKTLGKPATAQIWNRRLEEAAELLRAQTDGSITKLALHVGFEDSAHFARAFRRRYGVSPREWRLRE